MATPTRICADLATAAPCSPDVGNTATVLVTAFEPFGGERLNASWEAAKLIDGWRCGDSIVAVQPLPVAYEICVARLVETVERLQPRAVLLTGQAARRGTVSVERFARNRPGVSERDPSGGLVFAMTGPSVLEATVSAAAVARAIREAGVAARISTDAGAYVCNHLYYGALRHLAAASPATAAIFVHLPAAPGQSPERASARRLASADAARALRAAVRAVL
jgi:pyroglutamyl-peptidase